MEPRQGIHDIEDDESVGFHFITSDDIDDYGVDSIVERIRKRVGDTPVYLRLVSMTDNELDTDADK